MRNFFLCVCVCVIFFYFLFFFAGGWGVKILDLGKLGKGSKFYPVFAGLLYSSKDFLALHFLQNNSMICITATICLKLLTNRLNKQTQLNAHRFSIVKPVITRFLLSSCSLSYLPSVLKKSVKIWLYSHPVTV